MPGHLILIWDYDAAIGQVNASYPYNFHETVLEEEIQNVDRILAWGEECDLRMTFACVGFAAEPGHYPYHVPEQIRKIHLKGHEIASHSWRHEWFPFLEREQIRRSLARSKLALEQCLGEPGAVRGFVPPFSRPMSWYGKGAWSLGDRVCGPWYPGASLGSLLPLVEETGYQWCRVRHRPVWNVLADRRGSKPSRLGRWERAGGVICVPQHYTGFDAEAAGLVERAVEQEAAVVLTGHPAGLSRPGKENLEELRRFWGRIAGYRERDRLHVVTASDYIRTVTNRSN